MSFFRVMKAELIRSWIIMRRYWFRTITGMVIGYGMLMVLVAGFIYSRTGVENTLNKFEDPSAATNFVLGFIIGMFAFGVVGMFTQGLQGMATTGVLEQLCMSPHGLAVNFMAQTMVGSVASIISSGIMVYAVTWSVGGMLHWDTIPILVLLTLPFLTWWVSGSWWAAWCWSSSRWARWPSSCAWPCSPWPCSPARKC